MSRREPVPPGQEEFARTADLYKRFLWLFEYLEDDIEIELPPSVPLWPLVPTEERTADLYGDLTVKARLPKRDDQKPLDPYRWPVVWLNDSESNPIPTVYAIVTDEFDEIRDEWRIPCETVLHILEQDEGKRELLNRLGLTR